MIQLASKTFNKAEQDVLDDLQSQIDSVASFAKKAEKAQSLWGTKGGAKGKVAFQVISAALLDMCVSVGICNYCEQSEANDIEHIYPKSFFPTYTFDWENYILACKQCNSGHKLDKGYVLDGNDDLVELVRKQAPPHSRIAFINIRTETPQGFMLLNPLSHKFELLPNLSKANQNKAEATLKILELNTRDTLIAARKSAARHFYEMLERLIRILDVKTKEELEELLTPYDNRFDMQKSLAELKAEIQTSFQNYISTYQHPSVWQTIKLIQSKSHSKWISLFSQLPDALQW